MCRKDGWREGGDGRRGALRDVLITVEGKRRGRLKEKHRDRIWERGGGGKVR